MVVIFRRFVQVDKNGGFYFFYFLPISIFALTFIISSKTEVGSAGEQPARDSMMSFK
jgi:hypothetical protein